MNDMLKNSLVSRLLSLKKPAGAPQRNVSPLDGLGLLSPEVFRDEIERELLRSDRSNHPLTLLMLSVTGTSVSPTELRRAYHDLARIVASRVRRTDCKGWLEDESGTRIGVLLWNTASPLVASIVESLRGAFAQISRPANGNGHKPLVLLCEVFTYPKDGDDNGRGRRQESAVDPGRGEGVGAIAALRLSAPASSGNGRSMPALHRPPAPQWSAVRSLSGLRTHRLPSWKRTMDIVLSSTGIVLMSPILALIALGVKLGSRGPILFKQDRVGIHGDIFRCLKFRSMRTDYDQTKHRDYLKSLIHDADAGAEGNAEKPMQKLDGANAAINAFGRFIRTTHLDELPQLFNVLRGDMSLVGPRPCIPYEAESYQQWCFRRFDTLPGITGLWQVKGKNHLTFNQMIRLDLAYIERCSILLDLKIILMTIPTIIKDVIEARQMKRKGESHEPQKA
jgi:lipopolysaccharide/colanic/teichoic acid biosynthesis glycosyltransferase